MNNLKDRFDFARLVAGPFLGEPQIKAVYDSLRFFMPVYQAVTPLADTIVRDAQRQGS